MKDCRTGTALAVPCLFLFLLSGTLVAAASETDANRTDAAAAVVIGDANRDKNAVQSEAADYQGLAGDEEEADGGINEIWAKIRHLRQKVRLKSDGEDDYVQDRPAEPPTTAEPTATTKAAGKGGGKQSGTKPFRIQASGSRNKSKSDRNVTADEKISSMDPLTMSGNKDGQPKTTKPSEQATARPRTTTTAKPSTTTGAPRLDNKLLAMREDIDADGDGRGTPPDPVDGLELYESGGAGDDSSGEDPSEEISSSLDDPNAFDQDDNPNRDIVTKFLRIVESQHLLGENCTAGTDFNLGEGVVDRYAQERFRLEADVAVNRANWLTRLWKYADKSVLHSEYLLHVNLYSMIEMDEDIFAAGNCYDK